METKEYSKLLSICIPSHNRGHRALALVRSLLAMDRISSKDDIEIIVSDNGSTDHTEEYTVLRDISDSHLRYEKTVENLEFNGNYCKIIKMSQGQYCLLVSDEDSINEAPLTNLIGFLEFNRNIGMIKSKTSYHYDYITSGYAKAGTEALKSFYLMGNYISGTIYNRDYVTDDLIDGLRKLYGEDGGYYYYPHLFVEGYILNLADLYYFGECLIVEGDDEGDIPLTQNESVRLFASWESRTKQLAGYLKLVRDLRIDDDRKQLMFMMAVCKTISLIHLVKDKYINAGEDWISVCEAAGNAILQIVSDCGIPVITDNLQAYLEVVAEFIRKDLI